MPVLLELQINNETYESPSQDNHPGEYPIASFAYGDPAENEAYDLYYPNKEHSRQVAMLEICTLRTIPHESVVRVTQRENGVIVRFMALGDVIKAEVLEDCFYYKIRVHDIRGVSHEYGRGIAGK